MKLSAIKIATYTIILIFICVLSCKKDESKKSYRYTMSTNGRLSFDSTAMVSKAKSRVKKSGKLATANSVNMVLVQIWLLQKRFSMNLSMHT
jgi:hypothetical protein